MKELHPVKKPRTRLLFILIGLVLVAGAGYSIWFFNGGFGQAAATPTAEGYLTTAVKRGTLSDAVTAVGTSVATQTVALSFPVSGTVTAINVQIGDKVTTGQVLATTETTKDLALALDTAKLNLQAAQRSLDELIASGPLSLAQAMLKEAKAEAALVDAQNNLRLPGVQRCTSDLTQRYYNAYQKAQNFVAYWEGVQASDNPGYGSDYITASLKAWRKERDQALINWQYCVAYTPQEIESSQIDLTLAQSNLEQAKDDVATLQANQGVDPVDLQLAQANVTQAKTNLANAQANIDGVAIKAPIDAQVLSISGTVGTSSGTGAFITLVDNSQPLVRTNVDEEDMLKVQVGCAASVVFDTMPTKTYSGTVTAVAPTLVSTRGVSYVQATITLTENKTTTGAILPTGLNASVDLTCNPHQNVLYIPLVALQGEEGTQAYVYVLNSNGEAEKRTVEIGLKLPTGVEILSGLEEGELVITSGLK